jgi:hypothetical protein
VNLILQRQLQGDAAKWRTVGRFPMSSIDEVLRISNDLAMLLEPSAWRLVTGDMQQRRLAAWTAGEGWRVTP